MSRIDKTLYADSHEIAAATGKSVRRIHGMANESKWEMLEEKVRGRYPKKWFLIVKLPKSVRTKVLAKRKIALSKALHQQQNKPMPNWFFITIDDEVYECRRLTNEHR